VLQAPLPASRPSRRRRVVGALLATIALAVVAYAWIDVTDPWCWKGYLADDGQCAWE
jgi:ferric-dicitrate binding protein FerR (iron transport regulator)